MGKENDRGFVDVQAIVSAAHCYPVITIDQRGNIFARRLQFIGRAAESRASAVPNTVDYFFKIHFSLHGCWVLIFARYPCWICNLVLSLTPLKPRQLQMRTISASV